MIKPGLLLLASSDRLVHQVLYVLYPASHVRHRREPPSGEALRIALSRPLATTHPGFLSVAIDSSQLVGGHWWSKGAAHIELTVGSTRTEPFDFGRPRLVRLAAELAPGLLRIGGTEADRIYYDLDGGAEAPLPPGYDLRMTREQWDALHAFTRKTGLRLMFTLNAGPGDRDARGDWTGENARELLSYARRQRQDVAVWELGNEVNVHWLTQGIEHRLGEARYARDYRRFRQLVDAIFPKARTAAAAAFLWPVMGEPPPKLLPKLTQRLAGDLDILTWHYYPQQSRRCWSATRRAAPGLLLQPPMLDELDRHLSYVESLRKRHAPFAELWLGETGGAQCGGEPGVSDRHESSLWWLDQLGKAAAHHQRVVVRQTLIGSHYGLLDDGTLAPRPDYWASVFWKRLMGPEVLRVSNRPADEHLRAYAHCQQNGPSGALSLLLLNTDPQRAHAVRLPVLNRAGARVYRVTADSLDATAVRLGGRRLRLRPDGSLPALAPQPLPAAQDALTMPPASYAFVVFPAAEAAACHD